MTMMFPILMDQKERRQYPQCPQAVPWELVRPHEAQARANHYQSLATLASRGGLCPIELMAVVQDRDYYSYEGSRENRMQEAVDWLVALKGKHCPACGGTGIMPGDPTAPPDSILRVDVPCPECQDP